MQSPSHFINTRSKEFHRNKEINDYFLRLAQTMYPAGTTSYYPQQQQAVDHDYKQQTTNYNYVPVMSTSSYQHGNGVQVPILLHQQPNGQIQYIFPAHSLQQQAPLPSSDGQYMPVTIIILLKSFFLSKSSRSIAPM